MEKKFFCARVSKVNSKLPRNDTKSLYDWLDDKEIETA